VRAPPAKLLIDSHCHFCSPELLAQEGEVLSRMRTAGVHAALNICTTLEEAPQVIAFAQRHEGIFAAVGVHPDNTGILEPDVAALVRLGRENKVVAVGETGLDYYRLPEPLDWQRERFRVHIRAARELARPLVIHTRSSAADTLRILREEHASEVGGVMHCFTEDLDTALEAVDLGFLISFSGILTFKSAKALREVAARVPIERILVETDAPWLAPVPVRGKTNEPAFVAHVADCLAQVRGLEPEAIGKLTTENFCKLFNVLQ
jgi:TatD DNase family protein